VATIAMNSAHLGRRAVLCSGRLAARTEHRWQSTVVPTDYSIAGQNKAGKAIYLDSQVRPIAGQFKDLPFVPASVTHSP